MEYTRLAQKAQIAINEMALHGKLTPGDTRWARFNDSFVNRTVDTIDLANAIYTGHSYAAWHRGRRCVENFLQGQHIAVDLDTGDERSSIDYILAAEFVQVYGGLVHTTPSHTPTDPRARIVFFLDQPITDASAYKRAIGFVYSLFPGADPACIDCSRFFYGSLNCQMEWLGNVLPLAHLRSYYARWAHKVHNSADCADRSIYDARRASSPKSAGRTQDRFQADALLDYAIADSAGQGRNNRGYRLARQLREIGVSQMDAEGYVRRFQQAVARQGQHDYTEYEALASLRSAYNRGALH